MQAVGAWILALLLAAAPAAADIPGAEAPAFRRAVSAWLAEDEAAALPALAGLAAAGNAAAQVLLARIDKAPALQGPWLSALPREERIALLRAPGGHSGRSWMRVAAEAGLPEAEAWVALWSAEARAEIVLDLARAGEARAAREAALLLAARQPGALAGIAEDPDFPEEMRLLALAGAEGEAEAARRALLEGLDPGDPRRLLLGEEVAAEDLEGWLLSAPLARPLAAFCRAHCPATAGACARAALSAMGGFLPLAVFGSPSETLLPAEDFAESAKGRAALLRNILLLVGGRGRAALAARASHTDDCFGAELLAEWKRY